MSAYALASGRQVPSSVLEQVEIASFQLSDGASDDRRRRQIRPLVQAHNQLVQIVLPATPRTLMLLDRERTMGKASPLGPVRLIRHMMLVSAVLLVLFLSAPLVGTVNPSIDIFTASGTELVVNEVFLLAAAGIGAAFANLFKAYRYVGQGTYDPKYESSYWIRFVLGLIAGIILGSLVPIKSNGANVSAAGALSKPFLALIGGFSASVLFRILTRVVGTLESLVQGESGDAEGAKTLKAQAEAVTQQAQGQMHLAAMLVKLREQVAAGISHKALEANVNKLLEDLLPLELGSEGPDRPETSPRDRNSDVGSGAPSIGGENRTTEGPSLTPSSSEGLGAVRVTNGTEFPLGVS
jgi:hypothetical protein